MKLYRSALAITMVLYAASQAFALSVDPVKRYFLLGDYKQAIKEGEQQMSTAARGSKGLDELYYYLALSYLKDGNTLRASDIFDIIINEIPSSRLREDALLGSADTYFMRSDFNTAGRLYKRLLQTHSKTKLAPAVYYRLIQLGRRTGDASLEKEYRARLKSEYPASPEANSSTELFPQSPLPEAKPAAVSVASAAETPKKSAVTENENFKDTPAEPVVPKQPMIIMLDEPAVHDPVSAFFVQVGAFSSKSNANKLRNMLQKQGFSVVINESVSKNKPVYKVRVGAFASQKSARDTEKKLIRLGYPTKIVP